MFCNRGGKEAVLLPSVRPSFRRMGSEKRRLPGSVGVWVGAQSPLLIPTPSLFTYGPERALCATIAEEDASFVTYPSLPLLLSPAPNLPLGASCTLENGNKTPSSFLQQ